MRYVEREGHATTGTFAGAASLKDRMSVTPKLMFQYETGNDGMGIATARLIARGFCQGEGAWPCETYASTPAGVWEPAAQATAPNSCESHSGGNRRLSAGILISL